MDLNGLEAKWAANAPWTKVCAGCGKRINDDPDDEGFEVPLVLFRGEGDEIETMYFHMDCGAKRMKPSGVVSLSE